MFDIYAYFEESPNLKLYLKRQSTDNLSLIMKEITHKTASSIIITPISEKKGKVTIYFKSYWAIKKIFLHKLLTMKKLLSKRKLCILFGQDEKISLYMLRRHFFTNNVLNELGITVDEYTKIKTFDVEQTKKIKTLFAEDLKNSI